MTAVFSKSKGLVEGVLHYCPGCSHGIIHKLVAEVLVELGVLENTIGLSPVGCSGISDRYFNCDMVSSSHGRAPAIATGVKRSKPDSVVFTYQGDGDIAAIGTAEIVHAAQRGENITTIFVNNAIYGMTGGQMAPTTLPDQTTTTTPYGRQITDCGNPIRLSEMLAPLDGIKFIERVMVHDIPSIRKAKKAIKRAFQCQLEGRGYSMVEVLAACPTNWRMSPIEASDWVKDNMASYFPVQNFKDFKED